MTTMTRAAAIAQSVQGASERTRILLTRRNIYYGVVAVLAAINLYLLAQMFFTWRAANSENAEALTQQTVVMKTAEIAKKPLEGLDSKLTAATADADKFYDSRLPVSYSEVLAELGALTKKQNVKLVRVQYAESPVLESGKVLTEIRMDASLNGDYRPLVVFMNSLERDKMFFLISNVTLTGQQSGVVGLRLRLTTYLRPGVHGGQPEKASDTAPAKTDEEAETR
jgi:hypothetical protein